jgi:lysophospholipase L1-like esterase
VRPPAEPRAGARAGSAEAPREPAPGAPGAGTAADPDEPGAASFLDAPAGTLDALFAALEAAERGEPTARVLLAVFGDSHTAGDAMTSRLRADWQARFGDAGRGLVAAGRPTARHYYQRDVRYGASGPWRSAVGGTRDPEPYGVAGLRVYGERRGAQLWVETCPDCKAGTRVAQLEVLYHAAPDRGLLRYRVDDGAWQSLPTRTTAIQPPHPARHVIAVPDGPHRLTLEHGGGGPIDLYGVVLERQGPGVIVDALGVVGRRLASLRSWDWSIIGDQLATRDPRLVVLQYGTNESDDPALDLDALARQYDDLVLRIRAAAPSASILILGPPDVAVREAGAACDRRAPARPGAPPIDAGVPPECQWRTPGILREIIAVEHAAALRNRVAFFDTFAAMGGPDRMDGWAQQEPRWAAKDRVHFTELGYQAWADALSRALLAAYATWRRRDGRALPAADPPPTAPPAARAGAATH